MGSELTVSWEPVPSGPLTFELHDRVPAEWPSMSFAGPLNAIGVLAGSSEFVAGE